MEQNQDKYLPHFNNICKFLILDLISKLFEIMENKQSSYPEQEFQNYDQQYQDAMQGKLFTVEEKQKFQAIKKQQQIYQQQQHEGQGSPKQKNRIHLKSSSIDNQFGTQTLQSVPYVQSRFSLDFNAPSQEEFKSSGRSPKEVLKKFTNFIEFHSLKVLDIWEQQLQINIDEFIKRVQEKLGYSFANDELIALMKVASKNPILEAQDFINQEMLLEWKQQAEIIQRRIKLNSRRRHEKNHQNLDSSCIQQKQQYDSYLRMVQQTHLSNDEYDKMIKRPTSGQVKSAFKKDKISIDNVYKQIGKQGCKINIVQPSDLDRNRNNSMKNLANRQNFEDSRATYKYSGSGSAVFPKGRANNGRNITSASTNHLIIQGNTNANNRQKSNISRLSNNHLSTLSAQFDPLNSFKMSRMSSMMREKQKELGLQNDINTNMLEKKWDCIVKTGQINRWLEEKEDPRRFKINNFQQKIEIIEENLASQQEKVIPEVVFLKKYRSQAAQNQKRKISESKKQNNAPPVLKKNSKNNLKGTVLMVLEEKDKLTRTNLHNRLQQRDQQLNFLLIQIMRTKSLFQQQHKILTQNLINNPSANTNPTANSFA